MTTSIRLSSSIFLASMAIAGLSAAPTITGVANAAANRTFAFGIAQGTIFVIFGSGLGPANISVAPSAFQTTTLSGTSVAVTVGTTTVNALMYYTSATQVAALLPSNTPTGTGSFTVTYNGQTSSPANHGITQNFLGIFTIDSSGLGPGIITYPDYSLVSAEKAANCGGPNTTCGAANPGDTLILWGTGLGPVGGDDASGAGLGQNMPQIPLTIWMGGVQAPVTYQGRSGCCIGEDQIVFTVPNGVPTGCAVPLVVQIGGTTGGAVGNTVVIPVGTNGSRSCTPVSAAFGSVDAEQAILAGPVTFAELDLEKNGNGSGGLEDDADFKFEKIPAWNPATQPFAISLIDNQPLGTCIVYPNLDGSDPNLPFSSLVPLDGGSSFTLKGPNGSVNVPGATADKGVTISATGAFLVPGSFTVTGTGGADVGPFTETFTIPVLPTMTGPAISSGFTVTRSNGLTFTWKGGGGNVQIAISSALDNTNTRGVSAICTAPASAGIFTIPPYVLLSLPAGNFGFMSFSSAITDYPFTATGLSLGFVQTQISGPGFGLALK